MNTSLRAVLVVLLFQTLGCGGTGTGNPTIMSSGPNSNVSLHASASILERICDTLARCSSGTLTKETCKTAVLALPGLEYRLGLPAGSYPSYQAIIDAETQETIQASTTATQRCLSDLDALSCSDPAVSAAYRPGDPDPYAHLGDMIPQNARSCGSVF